VAPKIEEYGGRVVKLMGDGLLAEFPSVASATEWALEVQTAISTASADEPSELRIEYRVGVNLGDVIVEGRWMRRTITTAPARGSDLMLRSTPVEGWRAVGRAAVACGLLVGVGEFDQFRFAPGSTQELHPDR
jgi:hypothetical protein